jgi:hypothetical protein
VSGLQFFFREVLDEIEALRHVSEPLVSGPSVNVLRDLQTGLNTFQEERSDRAFDWGISDERPLVTVTSEGEYEMQGRKGTIHLYAEITSIWRIVQVRTKLGKRARADRFALDGKASTRVRLRSAGDHEEIGMWRMEVGDAKAPGCTFHVQVLGENDVLPFPKALSVPRLPAQHASPPAVVEYVLSELFQSRWDKLVGAQSHHLKRWAPIQKNRFRRLFDWQLKVLHEKSLGSPWVTLKREKPNAVLFTEP